MNSINHYLFWLLFLSDLRRAGRTPTVFESKKTTEQPDIVFVQMDLSRLAESLNEQREGDVLHFLDRFLEKAFLIGAQEVRTGFGTVIDLENPEKIKGELEIVFFGAEKARMMMIWLEEIGNQKFVGSKPEMIFQVFDSPWQYQEEVARLEDPKA